jgi:hypothetical protein
VRQNPRVRTSVVLAYGCLVAAVAGYGTSSLLLSQGSHAVRGRIYLVGLAFQAAAFLLAFAARVELPLLVVQAAVAASVAVTAAAGHLLHRWRLHALDGAALVAVVGGIALAGSVSLPSRVGLGDSGPMVVALVVALACVAGAVLPTGATAAGALAGLAFGSSAIAARALAGDPFAAAGSSTGVLAAVALVAGLAVGQVVLTSAFRRGGVTGPVAAMYVAATVWPAAAGLAWLGDRVRPGASALAAAGVVLALAGATVLARHEQGGDQGRRSP